MNNENTKWSINDTLSLDTLTPWREQWSAIPDDFNRSKTVLDFYLYKVLLPQYSGAKIENTDGANDGGLDGYLISEPQKKIIILQSKWKDKDGTVLSKKDARELLGFYNDHMVADNVNGLRQDVGLFVKKFNSILKAYKVELRLITNGAVDQDDLSVYPTDSFTLVNVETLTGEFKSALSELEVPANSIKFDLMPKSYFEFKPPDDAVRILQCVIRGDDLKAAYDTVGDKLLIKNLRLAVGGRINSEIVDTADDSNERGLFYLYHNGISIVCDQYKLTEQDPEHPQITLANASIVNGGQSTVSLCTAEKNALKHVFLPCKITENHDRDLTKKIAKYNNTQNPMDVYGWIANDPEIVFLQNFAATMINPPVFLQRRKGAEKWTHVRLGSDKPAPPKIRRTSYVDAAQSFFAFTGHPSRAYSSPKPYITPPNPCYYEIVNYPDPRVVIVSALLANYEDAMDVEEPFTKYWDMWMIAAYGHLFNYKFDKEEKEKAIENLLSSFGPSVYSKSLRDPLRKLFISIFKKYYSPGLKYKQDYLMQGFFKGQADVFPIDSVKGITVSDVKAYVGVDSGKFSDMRDHQKVQYSTYDVPFAIFAAAIDMELAADKKILSKLARP
jgi:hypothetical protein